MRKFGVVDVVLAVLVIAGITANIYVYGFYNKETSGVKPETSGNPIVTTQIPSDTAKNPATDENRPAPGVAESPAPSGTEPQTPSVTEPLAPEPSEPASKEPVVNTLVYRLDSLNVTVNGREAAIDKLGSAPYFQDGAAMLPLKATYEILGGSIELDSNTGYISAVFLDTSLKVKAGETGAEIGGAFTALSVAPVAKNGATYVHARPIADALGAEIIWDGDALTITLKIPSESLVNVSSLLPPASAPVNYTPSGAPATADFAWYMDGGRTAPQDAARITDMSQITGDWKMFVWGDPDHKVYSEWSYILATLNIDVAGGSVTIEIQELTMVDEDGTTQDISQFGGPYRRTGGYLLDGGGISQGDPYDRYTITEFYAKDGKQYGIGTQEVPSGEPCYIALVRP